VTIVVAVTEASSVKTSSLAAVVIPFVGVVSSAGITIFSCQPTAVGGTMWGCGCGGDGGEGGAGAGGGAGDGAGAGAGGGGGAGGEAKAI